MQEQIIIPALIPVSATALTEQVHSLSFAHELQIDVVDGEFVPFTSWPYRPAGAPADLATVLAPHSIEVDLMTVAPVAAGAAWVAAGAERLVFHIETVSVAELSDFMSAHPDVSVSVSALNDTSWETMLPYLELVDQVQLMGIAEIGAQGQPFDERVLERIQAVRETYSDTTVTIDGSVNEDTIERLITAGADRLVVGSALLQASNLLAQYRYLETLTRPQ